MPVEQNTIPTDNEYYIPFRNIVRVIQRGTLDGRLLPEVGKHASELEGLARQVVFLAVACSHDDKLIETPVVGYRVSLGKDKTWEYNYPKDTEEKEVELDQSVVGLVTKDSQRVTFVIDTQRNGDINLYRQEN